MINFYPGPSKIQKEVSLFVKEGMDSGLLAMNHRSPEFMELLKSCVGLLRQRLKIPEDYEVLFTSSATECWEIIAQSLVKGRSYHLFNGAFGEKWMTYTSRLGVDTTHQKFDINDLPQIDIDPESDVICITQNETSNGTQVPTELLMNIEAGSDQLVAVDATSSLGGIDLPIECADLWFASVQKCFGLPAGMGMMICSPKGVERAFTLDERDHYNSLTFLIENARKYQTAYTPNILDIYLLKRVMEERSDIGLVHHQTIDRYNRLVDHILNLKSLSLLVVNDQCRSNTVLAIVSHGRSIEVIMDAARKEGMVLGNGYGPWKGSTFRLANFPAVEPHEWSQLEKFLENLD